MGGCNVQCTCYTDQGRYGLSCLYPETVESVSSAGSVRYIYMVCMVCWSLSYVCCEILLLLNMIDMDQ